MHNCVFLRLIIAITLIVMRFIFFRFIAQNCLAIVFKCNPLSNRRHQFEPISSTLQPNRKRGKFEMCDKRRSTRFTTHFVLYLDLRLCVSYAISTVFLTKPTLYHLHVCCCFFFTLERLLLYLILLLVFFVLFLPVIS